MFTYISTSVIQLHTGKSCTVSFRKLRKYIDIFSTVLPEWEIDMILNSWFLSFREGFRFSVNICCGESKKELKDECHERECCF